VFPNSRYFRRRKLTVDRIIGAAKKQGFTDVILTEEDRQNRKISKFFSYSSFDLCAYIESADVVTPTSGVVSLS